MSLLSDFLSNLLKRNLTRDRHRASEKIPLRTIGGLNTGFAGWLLWEGAFAVFDVWKISPAQRPFEVRARGSAVLVFYGE